MCKIKETNYFSKWLLKLKDIKGKVSIFRRLKRVKNGNFGDYKSLGGDKSTQAKNIEKAKQLAQEYLDE